MIRRILDRELSAGEVTEDAVRQQLAELADHYHELTGTLFDSDPDLRIE